MISVRFRFCGREDVRKVDEEVGRPEDKLEDKSSKEGGGEKEEEKDMSSVSASVSVSVSVNVPEKQFHFYNGGYNRIETYHY